VRRVLELLRASLRSVDDPLIDRFVAHLREGRGAEVAAIIFYGSCLFQGTRTPSSFPDFYLLTDDLLRYHRSLPQAALNLVLPPNVYYARFAGGLRCKVCVMSTHQFEEQTSSRASDLHHLGRFSKRLALVHARDAAAEEQVARGALRSILTLIPHALALLPEEFSAEELILTQLGLSYRGEQRVAEPDKVQRLFEAARDHYLALYPLALELYAAWHGVPRRIAPGRYHQPAPDPAERARTASFLRLSRVRGVMRWPKYILTVEDWVDYILGKLERHQGIHLELSERERRYPLIFGWRRYLELRRRGVVR